MKVFIRNKVDGTGYQKLKTFKMVNNKRSNITPNCYFDKTFFQNASNLVCTKNQAKKGNLERKDNKFIVLVPHSLMETKEQVSKCSVSGHHG